MHPDDVIQALRQGGTNERVLFEAADLIEGYRRPGLAASAVSSMDRQRYVDALGVLVRLQRLLQVGVRRKARMEHARKLVCDYLESL